MRHWTYALLVLVGMGVAARADALPITLTLVPSSASLMPGQGLSVDVVVDGLFDAGEIALESFDLDLAFDNTRLQFDALAFGSSLGDPNDGGETFLIGPGNPNVDSVVEMGEFSFLSAAQLLALQNAPFTLASIEFTALDNPGAALLELINLSGSSLGGVGGQALGNELAPSPLSVMIVPEPGVAALLLAALVLLGQRARSART